VATKDTSHDAGSQRARSPIEGAAVLLIYIAMYLAVWWILRLQTSPDAAAAIAPDSSMAPPASASASTSPAGVGESPPSDSLGQVSERTDNSRECGRNAAIDSKCTFD
jgi:hypothetical protein